MNNNSEKIEDWDLYGIIDCDPSVDAFGLKKAYRQRALQVHPDKHPDDPKAQDKFDQLKRAFEWLHDDENRKKYDSRLKHKVEKQKALQQEDVMLQAMRARLEAREKAFAQGDGLKRQKTAEEITKQSNAELIATLKKQGAFRGVAGTNPVRPSALMEAAPSASPAASVASASASSSGAQESAAFVTRDAVVSVKWKKAKEGKEKVKEWTEQTLSSLLSDFGEIILVKVKAEKRKALVVFLQRKDAEECVSYYEHDKKLKIHFAAQSSSASASSFSSSSSSSLDALAGGGADFEGENEELPTCSRDVETSSTTASTSRAPAGAFPRPLAVLGGIGGSMFSPSSAVGMTPLSTMSPLPPSAHLHASTSRTAFGSSCGGSGLLLIPEANGSSEAKLVPSGLSNSLEADVLAKMMRFSSAASKAPAAAPVIFPPTRDMSVLSPFVSPFPSSSSSSSSGNETDVLAKMMMMQGRHKTDASIDDLATLPSSSSSLSIPSSFASPLSSPSSAATLAFSSASPVLSSSPSSPSSAETITSSSSSCSDIGSNNTGLGLKRKREEPAAANGNFHIKSNI